MARNHYNKEIADVWRGVTSVIGYGDLESDALHLNPNSRMSRAISSLFSVDHYYRVSLNDPEVIDGVLATFKLQPWPAVACQLAAQYDGGLKSFFVFVPDHMSVGCALSEEEVLRFKLGVHPQKKIDIPGVNLMLCGTASFAPDTRLKRVTSFTVSALEPFITWYNTAFKQAVRGQREELRVAYEIWVNQTESEHRQWAANIGDKYIKKLGTATISSEQILEKMCFSRKDWTIGVVKSGKFGSDERLRAAVKRARQKLSCYSEFLNKAEEFELRTYLVEQKKVAEDGNIKEPLKTITERNRVRATTASEIFYQDHFGTLEVTFISEPVFLLAFVLSFIETLSEISMYLQLSGHFFPEMLSAKELEMFEAATFKRSDEEAIEIHRDASTMDSLCLRSLVILREVFSKTQRPIPVYLDLTKGVLSIRPIR